MPTEPPVRVGNGSVKVEIHPDAPGTDWAKAGPWKWVRTGPASDGLGQEWVTVNGEPATGKVVQVKTTEGEMFFSFMGGRTHLDTVVQLERRDVKLLRSETAVITGTLASAQDVDEGGPNWAELSGSAQG